MDPRGYQRYAGPFFSTRRQAGDEGTLGAFCNLLQALRIPATGHSGICRPQPSTLATMVSRPLVIAVVRFSSLRRPQRCVALFLLGVTSPTPPTPSWRKIAVSPRWQVYLRPENLPPKVSKQPLSSQRARMFQLPLACCRVQPGAPTRRRR